MLGHTSKMGGGKLTIAFTAIADFKSFIGQEYISGIVGACKDYDINFINMCEVIKYSFFDDIHFLPRYFKKFRFMKKPLIDGLISWASSLGNYLSQEQIVNTFNALKPLPMVDIGYLDIPGVTALRIDNTYSIRLIIEHLVKVHGYKKIAFMGSKNSFPHANRLQAFKDVLAALHLDVESAPVFMTNSLNEADIVRGVDEIFEQYSLKKNDDDENQIHAIVTSSDIIAAKLINELEKRDVHVPDDVAVTGFNNQYQGITCSSPVTTINLEYFKRGYMAVELLIDQIMEPKRKAEVITVPTSLIVRESCGCFENEILQAGKKETKVLSIGENSSETEFREHIFSQINTIFAKESYEHKMDLVSGIFEDLYKQSGISRTLKWFRQFLSRERNQHFDSMAYQQKITELRQCMLQLAGNDIAQREHLEDICNELRVFCSTISDYESKSHRDNPYYFNNIAQTAIQFATVSTGNQMKHILKANLSKIGIPGIILSLSDNMTFDLETSNVALIVPEPDENERRKLPYKISNEALFPKSFFPKNKRFSMVLEILHHNERYFGFAFMYMHFRDMEIYDSVRTLLCHSLYNLYLKEGRTKEHSMLLNTAQLKGILQSEDNSPLTEGKLTAQQINSYLIEHIGEMTNLDQMAETLGVSKSKLGRTAKQLTGHTVRTLHEKLKMEMAKIMILENRLKLTEIAERLGFLNVNYFSSVFKKNFGESPSNWAKGQKREMKLLDT